MSVKVFAIGEAMAELSAANSETSSSLLKAGYGGDVINTLIHLNRLMGDTLEGTFVSGIGQDIFSDGFRDLLEKEGLSLDGLVTDEARNIGLYAIKLDPDGERSFTYWRDTSAARTMLSHEEFPNKAIAANADMVYFSGITLAILSEEDREALFFTLEEAKSNGSKIAFDPNYRERLWENEETAKRWIRRAYKLSHLIFTGTEDERLFESTTSEQIIETIIKIHGERDIVVTDGINRVQAHVNGKNISVPTIDVVSVVDTTGAGDAFNAGFLSVYLSGGTAEDALATANQLAAYVVTIRGAIPREEEFRVNYHGRVS